MLRGKLNPINLYYGVPKGEDELTKRQYARDTSNTATATAATPSTIYIATITKATKRRRTDAPNALLKPRA